LFTYNPATDTGKVRLLIADTVTPDHTFEDDEIAAVLTLGGNNVYSASADLLEHLAANRARLAVRLKRGDVEEDLTKVASALGERAKSLRARAQEYAEAESTTILEATVTPNWLERDEDADDPGWFTYLWPDSTP
jgi:hypothetical protein